MEDLSISELPELLNLADDDLIEVVDFSEPDPAKKNKKVRVGTLKAWVQGLIDASIGVAVPSPGLNVSTTQGNVTSNGGTNGSITATGSGGTSPYTYNLNGGAYQGSGTFSGLSAGTYAVGVKDSTGATFSKSVTLTQPAAPVPTLNAYYGYKATKATLTGTQIQAGTAVAITSGADITADYRANTQPQYLWMAEPSSEPAKTKWYGSDDNNGNIGTDQDLFGPPVVVDGFRFYVTEYQTQNTETTIQFRKA